MTPRPRTRPDGCGTAWHAACCRSRSPSFHDDGALDPDGFRAHVARPDRHRPRRALPACGTGEFFSLDEDEYRAGRHASPSRRRAAGCPSSPASATAGRRPCGSPGSREEAGADALLVLPHYLVAAPQDGLVAQLEQIAARTRLPLIAYQRGQVAFTVDALRRARRDPGRHRPQGRPQRPRPAPAPHARRPRRLPVLQRRRHRRDPGPRLRHRRRPRLLLRRPRLRPRDRERLLHRPARRRRRHGGQAAARLLRPARRTARPGARLRRVAGQGGGPAARPPGRPGARPAHRPLARRPGRPRERCWPPDSTSWEPTL